MKKILSLKCDIPCVLYRKVLFYVHSLRKASRKGDHLCRIKKLLNAQEQVDAPQVAAKRGEPSSFSMMARRLACGIGGDSKDNTSCSAGTWRT